LLKSAALITTFVSISRIFWFTLHVYLEPSLNQILLALLSHSYMYVICYNL